MSVKNCIQAYKDTLSSFQTALDKGQSPAPEYLEQFQKNQIEFYRQISNLSASDVQDLETICASLNEVIEKTKQIELRFTLEKTNGVLAHSMVKTLRSIADSFRSGEENKAIEEFSRSVPDGEGSFAGDVFGCLWKVKNRPNYGDFGRLSFYNKNENSDCYSTPLQKALAVEMAMITVLRKAFAQGQTERAYAEFHELPYRMKEAIIQSSTGRQWFFGQNIEKEAKIERLNAYQDALEKAYSQASESDHVRMLQQELQSKENLFHSALKQSHDAKWELLQLLQKTHQTALQKLEKLQGEQNTKLLNEVATLQNQNYNHSYELSALQGKIQNLQIENQQLKEAKGSLESKKVELVEEDFKDRDKVDKAIMIEKFAEFVQTRCPNYQIENIRKFIEQGRSLVEKIQNGQAATIPLEERKKEMVHLVWYMLYFAVCKDQGFSQGTIVFRDPGHAIVKFFLECGKPDVYTRPSTHFKGRLLPTFFEGQVRETTYGIDIPQDFQSGLPGNKQTANFSPIETKDGMDWSFLKPEDWGLGDMYQFMGHTWDFLASRVAHITGNVSGPDDRKEHVLPEVREAFELIYAKAVPDHKIPDDVKKFGIAGMKTVFEGMKNDPLISDEIKYNICLFLGNLRNKYDYLNTRNGNEVALGGSMIEGAIPQPGLHQSIRGASLDKEQLRDAQMRVKNAVHKKELDQGLASLKQKQPLKHTKFGLVDAMAEGFLLDRLNGKSGLDKTAIFTQINNGLQNNTVQLFVDGRVFKDAEALFTYLESTIQEQEKEQPVLRLMALMHEQSARAIAEQLRQWFGQPTRGVYIRQQESPIKIDVTTGNNPKAEVAMQFQLVTFDDTKPIYDKNPFATIEGKMSIDCRFQNADITAYVV